MNQSKRNSNKAIKDHECPIKDRQDDEELERELDATIHDPQESIISDSSLNSCSMISAYSSTTWNQIS